MIDTGKKNGRRFEEKTGPQRATGGLVSIVYGGCLGYPDALPGTYRTYRRMSSLPPLALAKGVKVAPMLASSWGWQLRDGTQNGDAILNFIREMFEPMRQFLLSDMMMALDMGCQSFEKVWDFHRSPKPGLPSVRQVYRKLKPLNQDLTQVLVDKKDGSFSGLKNDGVELKPDECFHYPYDMRSGDWYGRSLHENCRQEFSDYLQDTKEMQKLGEKLAGIIPVAGVLDAVGKDKNGADIDNVAEAEKLVRGIRQFKGVVIPSIARTRDDVISDPKLMNMGSIALSVLDLGTSSPALASLLEKRKHYHSEFMQAWLLPPRAALEGSHGTLAEAEAHASIGITHSELIHRHAVTFFNWYVVDPLLAINFGDEFRGAVYAVPAPLVDEKKSVLKQILAAILANPGTLEMALAEFDTSAIYETMEIPIAEVSAAEDVRTGIVEDQQVPAVAAAAISRTFVNANSALPAPNTPSAPVADDGLNGAQITAAIDVLAKVSAGQLSELAAITLLTSVGIPEAKARAMIASQRGVRAQLPVVTA